MKKTIYLAAVAGVLLYTASCSNQQETPKVTDEAEQTAAALDKNESIKRGEYLVTIGGCHDCHTPKVMTPQGPALDTSRLLSGHNGNIPLGNYDTAVTNKGQWVMFNGQVTAFAGPWGLSFAANLTPDETGLGGWTLDNFKKALKEGKYKGIDASRPLLPPMPWQNFAHITDEDIEAIFNYLQSIKPVSNRVPAAMLVQR
jgi:mono/diheme cytochrome c family protein